MEKGSSFCQVEKGPLSFLLANISFANTDLKKQVECLEISFLPTVHTCILLGKPLYTCNFFFTFKNILSYDIIPQALGFCACNLKIIAATDQHRH